jgi:enamine deaminase RidA (YjgF/YER057c/UK114 family)
MEKRIVNPWNWQASQGWSWGIEVTNATRTLYCSGQVSTDSNGRIVSPSDMRGQINQCLDNLETVLHEGGYELANVVRIDYYTTDADLLMANWDLIADRLTSAGCRAGGVLLGISRLAVPELLIEIQAIAVK